MPPSDFQSRYFSNLKKRFSSKQAMIEAVAEELHLSRDAIYRRVRGDSQLTANELATLARSFEQPLPDGQQHIPFKYNRSEGTIRRPEDYFAQLATHFEQVRQLTDPRLYIANPGIPIFYEMLYPRLLTLKLYVYGNTCWDFPGWREMAFSNALIDPQLLDLAFEMGLASLDIPGVELWSLGLLNTTLDQIEYLHVAGRFEDPEGALLLLDDTEHMINHLHGMARVGKKYRPGGQPTENSAPFRPVHNELANNDNAIIVESKHRSTLFVTFITPNFLQTEDAQTCRVTREWFDRMAAVSGSLGPEANKYREWFFNRLRSQVDQVRRRVLAGAY
ncbi:hypothetical protein CLV84_1583 [Neolewinella xylanilytica]|uniref:HTH cro/C1-type domain-containing protein n=1 Tax=Neolewinella xylanilytica TaxID=1514080 RepID=A0A2S6IAT4_9BACT|nr:hypothetical protein [Neolewinella xylanilytica]PPK88614.1 hypothetical protein CLV84_1583 [Neolewinella xylanilytica]